ncbi:MAG TPA: MmcQ/YjbR family DNA-binding protein [Terracidiphilus sp.]
MDVESVRAYCLSFPAAAEKLQWGDALCFKVREKMFAVLGLDQVRLTFKCTREVFADLIERQDIRPSPYLGRHSWVMLDRLDALSDDEIEHLLQQSYEMVSAKVPKAAPKKIGGKTAKKKAVRVRARHPQSRKKKS